VPRIDLPESDAEENVRLWMINPHLSKPARSLSKAVLQESQLSMRLRELVRMRVAQLNACVL